MSEPNTGTWQVRPNGGTGDTITIDFATPKRERVPTPALFELVVYGPDRFDLIPKTDVAHFLAGAWLGGRPRVAAVQIGVSEPWPDEHYRRSAIDRLEFRFDPGALLTQGGDPYYTGISLREGEYDIVKMALDKQRKASRQQAPKPKKGKRSLRRRAVKE